MNIHETHSVESLLKGNSYPGRGIILGQTPDGTKSVAAYFIMGRSENSRNRIFSRSKHGIRTEAQDSTKMEDPSLIIYHPVRRVGEQLVVTNGDQTDTICDFLQRGKSFDEALCTREFEPDTPHFTSRISGLLEADGNYRLSILKSADAKGSSCARYSFSYEAIAGLGHFIHTYHCDATPLPAFVGEPVRVQISNALEDCASMLWDALDEDNKISLYVRFCDLQSGEAEEIIINKHGGRA